MRTDTRLGLQANYEVNPQLELTSQVVLRDHVHGSKPLDSVEWAYVTYRPRDDVAVRIGRTSPDLFLLTDYRNVGFAYPWVRPNVEFYTRLPIYSINGLDAAYEWNLGEARWRIKGFAGGGDAHPTVAAGQPAAKVSLRSGHGAVLTREEHGLTLRASVMSAYVSVQNTEAMAQFVDSLNAVQAVPDATVSSQAQALQTQLGLIPGRSTFSELGFSYDAAPWLFSGEVGLVTGPVTGRNAKSAYLSVGRRFDDVTLYTIAGLTKPSNPAAVAPDWSALGPGTQYLGQIAAAAANAARIDQHSLALGLRWEFHPQMALKVQLDQYWNKHYELDPSAAGGPEANKFRVGTVQLDFIF
ncbi:MAG: hypothetical protein KGL90_05825 [Burkholderiales bacterium]|nr:hypothetical protein [Burkholderiales bacterium]